MPIPPRPAAPQPIDPFALVATTGADGLTRATSIPALRGRGAVSVRDLGAVGDGRSHPLRQRYRSLDAARADFPHANSLDDEIDWAATQGAVNLVAARGGGQVISPAGIYLCNRTIIFPECRQYGQLGVGVDWLGEGPAATIYRWPDDLGVGNFAVLCPNRYDANGMYEGLWQDIGLQGPGGPAGQDPALGAEPAQMSGFGWGSRRRMTRCWVRGFRVGLDIVGDHSRFEDVVSRENYYSVYFARPSRFLYGDLLFEKCLFSGNAMAAIGVHPATQMGGCTMISCYIGGAPYGILKEAGDGDPVMVSNSVFLNCMFEYIGNAWLQDENTPRRAILRSVTFDTCYFQWRDSMRLTQGGRRRRAVWDFARAEHIRWVQPKEPFALKPGDDALLYVPQAHGCEIIGHVGHILHNCREAKRPFLHGDAVGSYGFRSWKLEEPGEWAARLMLVSKDGPVRQGDVLELTTGGQVRRASASPAPVAGICLGDAAPGEFATVAISATSLRVRCPDAVSDGFLAKGDDGCAVASKGTAAGNLIGWSNGARDGQAWVALRGLA